MSRSNLPHDVERDFGLRTRRMGWEFAAQSFDRASLPERDRCLCGQTTPATAGLTAAMRLRLLTRSLAPAGRLLVWER